MILSENSKQLIKMYLPEPKTLKDLSKLFAVFSDATRIKILSALVICQMSVSDISNILSMNQSTISHQLQTLRAADIVTAERKGKAVIYSLNAGVEKILEQGFVQVCI